MIEPVSLVLPFAGFVVFYSLHTATGGTHRPCPLVIVSVIVFGFFFVFPVGKEKIAQNVRGWGRGAPCVKNSAAH